MKVSHLALGTAALGRPGYINLGHAEDFKGKYNPATMEKHAHELFDKAWASGVRYFDAARSYGMAESFLSSWLNKNNADHKAVVVASKWGYTYTANWQTQTDSHEVKDHSLNRLLNQWQESHSILGEYLKIYSIHSATKESGVLENNEVLKELSKISKKGTVIGLTVSGSGQAETIRQAMKINFDGVPLFNYVQATWNLLEPSAASALQEAHEKGLGVVIKEAVANGRLTVRNHDPGFAAKRKILEEEAAHFNTTIDALAIAAALAQPWTDVVLSGATTVEQLESNLNALQVTLDEQTNHRLVSLAEHPRQYWDFRTKLPWN